MNKINKPFPFFLNDDKENLLLILGISLFIYAFIKLFKPFGALTTTLNEAHIYSIITMIVLTFNIILLPRLFPRFLDNSNWTLRKYLVFNIYNMLVITLFIVISHYFTRPHDELLPFHLAYLNDIWRTAAIGIMPIIMMTFILENRLMAATIAAGDTATTQLQQMHSQPDEVRETLLEIKSDFSESFQIPASGFLFAQAENNYSKIYTRSEYGVENQLVRIFVKDLAEQIGNDHIVRCHRSYMANIRQVDKVSGNANGYRLHFKDIEKSVPVSRAMGKDVLRLIDELSKN